MDNLNNYKEYGLEKRVKVLSNEDYEKLMREYEKFCKEHLVVDVKPGGDRFLFVFFLEKKETEHGEGEVSIKREETGRNNNFRR